MIKSLVPLKKQEVVFRKHNGVFIREYLPQSTISLKKESFKIPTIYRREAD